MKHEESRAQQTLFEWAAWMQCKWPELKRMYHVPNGGRRDSIEAARLKAEGVKPGVPDVVLPAARGGYFGLYIEMKTPQGRLSREQRDYLCGLRESGYAVAVCRTFEAARAAIEQYMGWPGTVIPKERGDCYSKL